MSIPQNGQTHSNELPTDCLSVTDHFVGLALKGLTQVRVQFVKCGASEISNYRPIFVLSYFPKKLEHIMYGKVFEYHIANDLQ